MQPVPGYRGQVFDQALPGTIHDCIQGYSLERCFLQQFDPAWAGGVMEHRDQAGSWSHGLNQFISGVPQNEHVVLLVNIL